MNIFESPERGAKIFEIRLKEKFDLIGDVTQFDFTLFRKLVLKNIDETQTKFELEELDGTAIYKLLRLEKFSERLLLIYKNLSMFSFSVRKNDFVENFNDFYYPSDDVLVLDGSSQEVVCWLDHEEFVILPNEMPKF